MKRLALFVGVLGAIAGGVVSYLNLSDVLATRARHNAFERLAASDVVQQERKLLQAGQGWVVSDSPIPPPPSGFVPYSYQVNKGGIQTVLWTKDYAVESIVTESGETLHPEPAPSFWQYLLPLVFPVVGFFIPWGLASAVVWVGAGFFETPK